MCDRCMKLEKIISKAHDELMNLQPCIGQLPKQYRPFIDAHVDVAMGILRHVEKTANCADLPARSCGY